jgi:hypothetical protein
MANALIVSQIAEENANPQIKNIIALVRVSSFNATMAIYQTLVNSLLQIGP